MLTLTFYDSPAKNQAIDPIPLQVRYPRITQRLVCTPRTVKLHLLCGTDKQQLVSSRLGLTSSSNVYADGQAYKNGAAQAMDFWFDFGFSQRAIMMETNLLTLL